MNFRQIGGDEAALLAPLNHQLIVDEGHRSKLTAPELTERMRQWLSEDYKAVVFEEENVLLGYALFRFEPEVVYLRQLFVLPQYRRKGIGRTALDWLKKNAWQDKSRIRIDVLMGNEHAHKFWRSIGFEDYATIMELENRR
jgi:GNAT superfamily N-acetyltransferase